jgi:hypothetical protein
MRDGFASGISGTAGLVRQIVQRPRVHHDDAERLHAAQVVEFGISPNTVAMMCHEPSALRDPLHDGGNRRPLLRRHPMSGASEPDLGQWLAAHHHPKSG